MSRMRWKSVRLRLTLWNVAVLALALYGCGMALCYRVQAEMQKSVDRQLANIPRYIPMAGPPRMWERFRPAPDGRGRDERRIRFGPGRSPGFDGRLGGGPSRMAPGQAPPDRRFGRGPESHGPPSNDPFAEFDEDTRRRLALQFPRLLTTTGRPLPGFSEPPLDPSTVAPAAAGQEAFSTVEIDGIPLRVLSAPIFVRGNLAAVIQFAHPLTEQQRLINGQVRTLVTLFPFALLIAGACGVFLTDRALRPVRKITQAAAEIEAADLSRRLEVTGQDEFAELATTFNGMIGRLDEAFRRLGNAYQRLEHAFEQQRRFTADASHELRTPLTRIKASVSLALADQRDAGAYRKALQVVDAAANVMNRLIQDLLLLARADAAQLRLELRPLPVVELLEDAVAGVPEGTGCPIRVQLPDESMEVLGDADSLLRLLANLISNALRHTPREGQITLSADAEEDTVVIRVEDTGEGIAPEHLPRVCDRFYRVDDARTRSAGGTGLGLAICRSIAEAHGGTLAIESVLGQGTTVSVTLPRAAEVAPGTSPGNSSPASHSVYAR